MARSNSNMMSRSARELGSRIAPSLGWIIAVAMMVAGSGAAAHEAARRQGQVSGPAGNPAARSAPAPEHEEVETEHIFGFTEGSSVHAPGETDLKLDSIGSFGKRGYYRHIGQKLEIHTGLVEGINVAAAVAGDFHRIRNVPDLPNLGPRYTASGGSLEVRWRILDREKAPFGLTFAAEPSYSFVDGTSGERGRGHSLETRLLFDRELVPDKLFAALNLSYELEKFRPKGVNFFSSEGEELDLPVTPCMARLPKAEGEETGGVGESCAAFARRNPMARASELGVSAALSYQALPNVFIGAEVRYLRAYEGLTWQKFLGNAVFVGPTFYAKLGERVAVAAAFSTQVAGHAVGVPGRLDLDNFSRHQAKLKLLYEF